MKIGISAALPTAFREDGSVDDEAVAAHAASCLRRGCDSVTLCGTTGEGASLATDERHRLHSALVDAGVPAEKIVVGLCATAVGDAAAHAARAASLGAAAFLVPPPFYFKGVEEDAVHAWYDEFLRRIAGLGIPVVLYHIPQVTGVPLSADLVRRLRHEHPDIVRGVKDSGGDWSKTIEFLERGDVAVLIGDERFLARGAQKGAKGSISGLANLCPERLVHILSTGEEDETIVRMVETVVKAPVVPAVKFLVARQQGNEGWRQVRPPLRALSETETERLAALFDASLSRSDSTRVG